MASPTVALNTPTDTGTVATLTPELKFTGTDADGDAITYEVQVDTVNTFDSSSVVASYATIANAVSGVSGRAASVGTNYGDVFIGNGSSLGKVSVYSDLVYDDGTGAQLYANIYATTGTYGSTMVPTGSAIATSDLVNVSTLSGTPTFFSLNFSGANQITLTSSTHYAVVFFLSGGTNSYVRIPQDYGTIYGGNGVANVGGTWYASSTRDMFFSVYDNLNTPLITALSSTDPGFADVTNGADTDPFASGDQIGYIVQTPLTNALSYYWRARGKDPLGTNTFGAWSSTRSFSVNTFTSPFPSFFRP